MALDLDKLRKNVAEAKGETYESNEPQLEGVAKEVWEERKALNKELDNLKAHSEGRDEVPGTPEHTRVQEIGRALLQLEVRLAELGVVIPKGVEALQRVMGEQGDENQEDETVKYREHLETIITDLESVGNRFSEAPDRFMRYVQGEVPYGSSFGEELATTEQFQTIQSAYREAPESFNALLRARKELDASSQENEILESKMKIKASLENVQRIFTITTKESEELWGTVIREQGKLANEYKRDRQAYEEEEYLKNVISLLRSVCEESGAMTKEVSAHIENLT